jgi:hypothetical protein
MAITHERGESWISFAAGDPNAVILQDNYLILDPGDGFTLVRTRLYAEWRVYAYSLTDSAGIEPFWWQGIVPFMGVWFTHGFSTPMTGIEPIGGDLDNNWVIWEKMSGELDWFGVSDNGHRIWSYVWRFQGGIAESFAQRKPPPFENLYCYLSWNWFDPNNLLNRSHLSFDLVYDTELNYGIDFFLKPIV